jgi:hypothetical protein
LTGGNARPEAVEDHPEEKGNTPVDHCKFFLPFLRIQRRVDAADNGVALRVQFGEVTLCWQITPGLMW